jgi:hypothetical protein
MIYIGLWPIFFAVEFVLTLWHGWLGGRAIFLPLLVLILLNLFNSYIPYTQLFFVVL